MKQLTFKKQTQQGLVDGVLRVHEKLIFLKYKQSNVAQQVLKEFKAKGLEIEEGKGWIKIDLLKDHDLVKLGEYEINQENDTLEEIEIKLFNFYKDQYKKQGFYLEEI